MASMVFVVFASLCIVCLLQAEDIPECESNHYFRRTTGECMHCSECIGNLIIREVCEADRDTICGPFVEFDRFQQSPTNNLHPSKNITFEWEDTVDSQIEEHDDRDTSDPTDTRVGSPVQIDEDKKWYTLAMALLGVLSFIALFVGIYIVAVCFVCRKRRSEKEIIYDPEQCTPLPLSPNTRTRLVETYIPSRDRLKRKRQTYTKDDAADGTVSAPHLNVAATSDEYDADNSGQTVSSSTSSHYVYFKSAEPPN